MEFNSVFKGLIYILILEVGADTLSRNVSDKPSHAVQQPRRAITSTRPRWKPGLPLIPLHLVLRSGIYGPMAPFPRTYSWRHT